jgi:hypothetical protein
MPNSATSVAKQLLESNPGNLEELRIHEFEDDASAHDDESLEKLYRDFAKDFDQIQAELSKQYGPPSRTGKADDDVIPLNGVFRFAIWTVNDKQLFAVAAHEDRGVPILLMLGTAEADFD